MAKKPKTTKKTGEQPLALSPESVMARAAFLAEHARSHCLSRTIVDQSGQLRLGLYFEVPMAPSSESPAAMMADLKALNMLLDAFGGKGEPDILHNLKANNSPLLKVAKSVLEMMNTMVVADGDEHGVIDLAQAAAQEAEGGEGGEVTEEDLLESLATGSPLDVIKVMAKNSGLEIDEASFAQAEAVLNEPVGDVYASLTIAPPAWPGMSALNEHLKDAGLTLTKGEWKNAHAYFLEHPEASPVEFMTYLPPDELDELAGGIVLGPLPDVSLTIKGKSMPFSYFVPDGLDYEPGPDDGFVGGTFLWRVAADAAPFWTAKVAGKTVKNGQLSYDVRAEVFIPVGDANGVAQLIADWLRAPVTLFDSTAVMLAQRHPTPGNPFPPPAYFVPYASKIDVVYVFERRESDGSLLWRAATRLIDGKVVGNLSPALTPNAAARASHDVAVLIKHHVALTFLDAGTEMVTTVDNGEGAALAFVEIVAPQPHPLGVLTKVEGVPLPEPNFTSIYLVDKKVTEFIVTQHAHDGAMLWRIAGRFSGKIGAVSSPPHSFTCEVHPKVLLVKSVADSVCSWVADWLGRPGTMRWREVVTGQVRASQSKKWEIGIDELEEKALKPVPVPGKPGYSVTVAKEDGVNLKNADGQVMTALHVNSGYWAMGQVVIRLRELIEEHANDGHTHSITLHWLGPGEPEEVWHEATVLVPQGGGYYWSDKVIAEAEHAFKLGSNVHHVHKGWLLEQEKFMGLPDLKKKPKPPVQSVSTPIVTIDLAAPGSGKTPPHLDRYLQIGESTLDVAKSKLGAEVAQYANDGETLSLTIRWFEKGDHKAHELRAQVPQGVGDHWCIADVVDAAAHVFKAKDTGEVLGTMQTFKPEGGSYIVQDHHKLAAIKNLGWSGGLGALEEDLLLGDGDGGGGFVGGIVGKSPVQMIQDGLADFTKNVDLTNVQLKNFSQLVGEAKSPPYAGFEKKMKAAIADAMHVPKDLLGSAAHTAEAQAGGTNPNTLEVTYIDPPHDGILLTNCPCIVVADPPFDGPAPPKGPKPGKKAAKKPK